MYLLGCAGEDSKVDRLERAVICLAENKKPKWEQVNLEKRLDELGLTMFFPEEVCFLLAVGGSCVHLLCCEGGLAANERGA